MNRKLMAIVPLLIFIFICVFLYQGLFANPREIQTGRIGQTVPTFNLPDLMQDNKRWTDEQLKGDVFIKRVGHMVPNVSN